MTLPRKRKKRRRIGGTVPGGKVPGHKPAGRADRAPRGHYDVGGTTGQTRSAAESAAGKMPRPAAPQMVLVRVHGKAPPP